jgi:glycosyltransferase involved in cell wall biosynthesis
LVFYVMLVVGFLWSAYTIAALRNIAAAPELPKGNYLDTAEQPQVSVIVCARDEGARIEQTVVRLLAQRDVRLQLIIVDDRSSDATPEILTRLSVAEPRLTVVRIDSLPDAWLGKCHACWQGAQRAVHPWILFADGDVHMADDLVARAMAQVAHEQADHLTLWPGLNTEGMVARASVLVWGQLMSLYAPPAQINADRGNRAVGVGAFNLIRADAYRAIGGHEALRMEVVDDMKLGLLVRRGGFRQRVYLGSKDIEIEWAPSVLGLVRVVEKNMFAAVGYSLPKSLATIGFISIIWLAGCTGPWWHSQAGWFALVGWCSPMISALIQARLTGWPWYVALFAPLGFVTFVLALTNSTFVTLRQRGIYWRGTFYSLRALREGMVR